MNMMVIDQVILVYPIVLLLIIYLFLRILSKQRKQVGGYALNSEVSKEAMLIKLKAYERLSLFISRIEPQKILIRLSPGDNESKEDYFLKLFRAIEQEFDHNITQQIYVSAEAWQAVIKVKNGIIEIFRATLIDKSLENAKELCRQILQKFNDKPFLESKKAVEILRNDVAKLG